MVTCETVTQEDTPWFPQIWTRGLLAPMSWLALYHFTLLYYLVPMGATARDHRQSHRAIGEYQQDTPHGSKNDASITRHS